MATGEDLGLSGQTQGVSAHCLDTKQMTSETGPGTEIEKLEPLITSRVCEKIQLQRK